MQVTIEPPDAASVALGVALCNSYFMSTSTEHLPVPEWDLADRLGKALRVAGMSVNEMALYLGVHRNTVSAWVNGRTPISGPAIRAWATRTNVDFDWLNEGIEPTKVGPPPPGQSSPGAGDTGLQLPWHESNVQPFGGWLTDDLPAVSGF